MRTETTKEERDEWRRHCGEARIIDNDFVTRLANDADTLARVLDQVIVREEWMPEWAEEWWKHKPGECSWFGMDAGNIDEAPDLRPDLTGPVTLPIIDAPEEESSDG